jgi:hypothetical protein
MSFYGSKYLRHFLLLSSNLTQIEQHREIRSYSTQKLSEKLFYQLRLTTTNNKMVLVCAGGVVNCVPCSQGSGSSKYGKCIGKVQPEQSREEVASTHRNKEKKLDRAELVALLESLGKTTEAIEKLLKVADKQVEEEKVPSATLLMEDITGEGPDLAELMDGKAKAMEMLLTAAGKQTEEVKVTSTASLIENSTPEGTDSVDALEEASITEGESSKEIEDESTEDELN